MFSIDLSLAKKCHDGELKGQPVKIYVTDENWLTIQSALIQDKLVDYDPHAQVSLIMGEIEYGRLIISQPKDGTLPHIFYAQVVDNSWYEPLVYLGEITLTE